MFTHLSRFARSSRLRTLAGAACLVALGAAGVLVASDPLPPPAAPVVSAASPPAATPPAAHRLAVSDVTLARAVLAAMDADPVLKDVNLVVSVVDRGAVIGGPVAGDDVRRRAEEVVRAVRGIESVKNACFVQADPDPLLRAAAERLRSDARPTPAALPGVALAPSSPEGFLPPQPPQPPSDSLAGANESKTVVQRPHLPGVSVLGAPVSPAAPGGAVSAAPPPAAPGALTGSAGKPADIRAAVVAIRQADPRFTRLAVELKPDGGLLVSGWSARAADAWDFAARLRKIPGVAQVAVDQNLVK